ncbi:M28 family peptidase, partial [bacterium]|nr:M28 family peptidase [bacterium]
MRKNFKITSLGFVFFAFFIFCTSEPIFGLGGVAKAELNQFVSKIRLENRLDRIGYLLIVELPPSFESEKKVFQFTGKFFYSTPDGYLTHVNYSRLMRMQTDKVPLQIVDKKRLDDFTEFWYLVWVSNDSERESLKAQFEPLFQHENTCLIRIRPEDEDRLVAMKLSYSRIDETLCPLRIPPFQSPIEKVKTPNPLIKKIIESIKGEDIASTVQKLQDLKSRYVREPGNSSATHWLVSEFSKIASLKVATHSFSASYYGNLKNVVAIQTGVKDPNTVFVVCAHMDSIVSSMNRKIAPGADDDASGSGGVLAIANALGSYNLPYTVVYTCVNAEEVGLLGSKALANKLVQTPQTQIKAVFAMDMIGYLDDNEAAVIGNTRSNWLIDVFKDTAFLYTGLRSKTFYDSNIWQSDHSSFWNVGVSAILSS